MYYFFSFQINYFLFSFLNFQNKERETNKFFMFSKTEKYLSKVKKKEKHQCIFLSKKKKKCLALLLLVPVLKTKQKFQSQ